ncbi:MAG: SDR family oxidoreductase [Ignavibacteriales bacterium]|nr:MAG: SDR family oxidoreductase [Ignavibacteriaceae bacterium]MBW7871904.1 SDR family oxidoreductase [Ignavibacteria bacterium]MCZ2144246.1 SDR family oxidoreductase [Ignavibacteriales bacterium]MBV6446199.1 Dihydroanticapsin 7-dehydrogenase [Ignavibacteriaceae bacterium]MBZ0195968.1 SDR family oxidoreductase [Ignavibacteriaceae bacterium]
MNDLFDLTGKTAVVTGSLGLLGKNHCKALLNAGATVVVTDLNHAECEKFANQLNLEVNNTGKKQALTNVEKLINTPQSSGEMSSTPAKKVFGFGADITSKQAVEKLRDFVLTQFGKIDILVNNAAINDKFEDPAASFEQSAFENYPLELWNASINVNLTGMFLCSQVLGSVMAAQQYGSIINIASTYGIVAPDQSLYIDGEGNQKFYKTPAYPVTKGAVISFTRFLAAYWGEKGVRVNSLTPGGVENNQDRFFIENYAKKTPLKRMAKPTDYMGALIFLASDASEYMTGANLVVDGGFTIW